MPPATVNVPLLNLSWKSWLSIREISVRNYSQKTDNGYDGTYPQKYKGRDGQIYVNNPKVVRLSEVYLIAAEAALKAGDTSAAAGYMNTLRKNRIENYTDVASITLDDILLERRLELFTEGQITVSRGQLIQNPGY